MKHTPGPWEIDKTQDGVNIIITLCEDVDGSTEICGMNHLRVRDERVKKDAQLIAASPIMVEYIILKAKEGCKNAEKIAMSAGCWPV